MQSRLQGWTLQKSISINLLNTYLAWLRQKYKEEINIMPSLWRAPTTTPTNPDTPPSVVHRMCRGRRWRGHAGGFLEMLPTCAVAFFPAKYKLCSCFLLVSSLLHSRVSNCWIIFQPDLVLMLLMFINVLYFALALIDYLTD